MKAAESVFYIAASEVFFDDEGLDVEIMLASGVDAVMSTLISRDAQIDLMGPEASIYVYEQGLTDYAIDFTAMAGSFYNGEGDYSESIVYTCYSAKASFISDRYDDAVAFTKEIQKAQTLVYEHTDDM